MPVAKFVSYEISDEDSDRKVVVTEESESVSVEVYVGEDVTSLEVPKGFAKDLATVLRKVG
tara:strand:+ start:410 stop:592 length:183 start_codon:yes stop_codon:yes gene_type:complete